LDVFSKLGLSQAIFFSGVRRGARGMVLTQSAERHDTIERSSGDTRSPPDVPDKTGLRPAFRNVLRVAVKLDGARLVQAEHQ